MWIQQKVHEKQISIVKMSKDVNRADIQTKPLSPSEHSRHVRALPVVRQGWTGCSPTTVDAVLLFALVMGGRAEAVAPSEDDSSNMLFWSYSALVLGIGLAVGFWVRGLLGHSKPTTRDCRSQTEYVDVEAYWDWSAVQIKGELRRQNLDIGQLKATGIGDLVRSRVNGKAPPVR